MNGRSQKGLAFWAVMIAFDMAIWSVFPQISWKYHLVAAVIAVLEFEVVPWIVEKIVRARRYAEVLRRRREGREN
jgi:hypothetical protein